MDLAKFFEEKKGRDIGRARKEKKRENIFFLN